MSNEIEAGCAAMPQPEISQEAARAMLAALRKIAEAHVPDQPASSPVDERTWALQHVARLRSVALGAIALAERGA